MIIISQLAQPPSKFDPKEVIRFMLQSIDKDQEYHFKFLVGCMQCIYRKGDLTPAQSRAVAEIYKDFMDTMRVQYPRLFEDPLPPPPEPERHTEGNVVFFNKNRGEE